MMEYTDPWTGQTSHIFPTGHPDKYPLGYFGSPSGARIEHLNPDQQIEHHQFWATRYRELANQKRPIEAAVSIKNAEKQEVLIAEAQANCVEIAQRLLDHRATYIHKLTPRDCEYIEYENELLRQIVQR